MSQNQKPKKRMSFAQKSVIVGTAVAGSTSAMAADVDASAGITVLAGAVAVIALVGAAKIVPNATIQVWGYVKQAFNRT